MPAGTRKRSRRDALGSPKEETQGRPKRSRKASPSPRKKATPATTRRKTVSKSPARRAKTPTKPRTPKKETKKETKATTKKTTTRKTATPKKKTATPKTRRRKSSPAPASPPPPEKPKRRLPQVPEDDEEIYWKGWKQIYLIGTEWENYDAVYDIEWDFDHLNEHLVEGFLSETKHPKYIYGTTESFQMAPDPKNPEDKEVYLFPVITVIDSKMPPPSKVGITSVQRGEEIKDMSDLKIEWVPYHRYGASSFNKKPEAFFMKCTRRRQQLEHMTEEDRKEYEYAIPYIWFPKNEMNKDFDTDVHIITEMNGRGLNFSFDWTFDELDDMVDEVLEEEEKEKFADELKNLIKEKVRERKAEIAKEKQSIKDRINALTSDEKESLDTLKCYKYYPQNDHYPIERSTFINRYYGHAKEVFPPVQDAIDYSNLVQLVPDDPSTKSEDQEPETKTVEEEQSVSKDSDEKGEGDETQKENDAEASNVDGDTSMTEAEEGDEEK